MAFSQEIVERIIDSKTDKRPRLVNGRYARKFKAAGWSKLRICIRLCIDTSKALGYYGSYGVPRFGVCAGTTNVPGTTQIDHAVGIAPFGTLYVYDAPRCYFSASATDSTFGGRITKNNAVTSGGSSSTLSAQHIARYDTTNQPSLFGMTIYRSGSDLKFVFHIVPNCSLGTFESVLASGSDTPTGATTSTEFTVTPDETTYGTLDSFFFAATDTSDAWEISDLAIKRIS